jgi:hypothetical protein
MSALVLLRSATAPVTATGVPVAVAEPLATVRVAKVNGWPWLSVWLTLANQDQSPDRLPSEALVCQAL